MHEIEMVKFLSIFPYKARENKRQSENKDLLQEL